MGSCIEQGTLARNFCYRWRVSNCTSDNTPATNMYWSYSCEFWATLFTKILSRWQQRWWSCEKQQLGCSETGQILKGTHTQNTESFDRCLFNYVCVAFAVCLGFFNLLYILSPLKYWCHYMIFLARLEKLDTSHQYRKTSSVSAKSDRQNSSVPG